MSTCVYPVVVATGSPGWSRARRSDTRSSTRQAIVDAALRLFAESDYVGVRVEDIAKAAGVSRATFYKHFAERDEILGELFVRLLGEEPASPRPGPAAGIEARIRELLEATIAQMLDDAALARFVYSLPIHHRAVLPGGAAEPAVFGRVREELAAAAQGDELRDGVTVARATELLGLVFEAAMRAWALGVADDPVERLGELLDLAFSGIARPTSP